MAYLAPEAIDDLVETNFNRMLKNRTWNDLSLTKQFYTVSDRFFRGKKMNLKGGPKVIWKLQIRNAGQARFIGTYEPDVHSRDNQMIGAECNWSIAQASYIYDTLEPDFQSQDMLLLVDHLLALEHGMYNRWFELLEDAMWTAPTAPATTTAQKLFGIPFWVQKNSSLGFNGGNPSGFSAGAGSVDASTYSGWKNYTGTYGAVSRDDLISKWLKAVDHCNFRPPHAYPTTSKLEDPQYVYYTTHPVMEASRKYLDSRQDNITDMSGVANPMFRSVPLQWVPALSNSDAAGYDSTNPIYGINWGAMDLCFNAGKEMQRIGPNPVAGQVNVRAVFTQAVLQLICHDRRSQFVLYQA